MRQNVRTRRNSRISVRQSNLEKILKYEHWNYPKLKNMPTNFELKRLKPKLDIVKKPENRVHELTDSNVSHFRRHANDLLDAMHSARFNDVKRYAAPYGKT